MIVCAAMAMPEDFAVITNGMFGAGWKATGWNGIEVSGVSDAEGRSYQRIIISDSGKPWSGVNIKNEQKPFTAESIGTYTMIMYINGDDDQFGANIGGQPFQISLSAKGKGLSKSGFLPASRFIEGRVIDTDRGTWQRVVVPLAAFERAADAGIIDSVSIQFMGAAPKAGIRIADIYFTAASVTAADEKPKGFVIRNDVEFPPFSALPQTTLMPRGARVTVSPSGNYLVNGAVRFFTGVQCEADLVGGYTHRPGYDERYNWIYDVPLNYESAQRLGIDSIGQFFPSTWTRRYIGAAGWAGTGTAAPDEAVFDPYLREIGLPVYVDMTCESWTHGILYTTKKIPDHAKSRNEKSHFLRYSIIHPDGIALYKEMMEAIVRRGMSNGIEALFYELFNEPAYHDDNQYNRAQFAVYLAKRYQTVDALNGVWGTSYASFDEIASFKNTVESAGLSVDWTKFMEESFTALCRMGRDVVRSIDPKGRTAVQIMGGDNYRNFGRDCINIYEVTKAMDVVSLPTGAGIGGFGVGLTSPPAETMQSSIFQREGILMAKFFLNASGGTKPLHDGEFYGAGSRAELVNAFWLELARGFDASYIFKWDKRAWDWKNEEEGKKKAESFSYLWLHPYAKSVDVLGGILDFKNEMKRAEQLLVPRPRYAPRIALLVSYPNARAAAAAPGEHNEILSYAGALAFSHWDFDVVMEEELSAERLSRYDAVIAAGVKNIYPSTPGHLEAYMKKGGVFIMGIELPSRDEYERPLDWAGVSGLALGGKAPGAASVLTLSIPQWKLVPGNIKGIRYREMKTYDTWRTIAAHNDVPVVVAKKVGSGTAYYIGAKIADYGLASILGSICSLHTIVRPYELTGLNGTLEPNIEVHYADRKDQQVFFLFNWDLYSKIAYLKPARTKGMTEVYDPVDGERYIAGANGVLVHCRPQSRKIVVFSATSPAVSYTAVNDAELQSRVERSRIEEKNKAMGKASAEAAASDAMRYTIDVAKTKMIDIRKFCNRQFVDQKPGDGAGGWTDQGENSLRGVPDGVQSFLGVPFDIIRWDMNNNTSCIVLGSSRNENGPREVNGIAVEDELKALYFLHTVGWSSDGAKAYTYRIHYGDGSTLDVPIVVGKNTDDWWIGKHRGEARVAWKNSEKKGFYAWRWENPQPEKLIGSIDIISAGNEPVPIVVAITGEKR